MLKAIVIHRFWLFQRGISSKGGTPPPIVSRDGNGNIQCNHRQHTMISLLAYDDFAISIRCFCLRHRMSFGRLTTPLRYTLFIIGYAAHHAAINMTRHCRQSSLLPLVPRVVLQDFIAQRGHIDVRINLCGRD